MAGLPLWVKVWLLATTVICTIDLVWVLKRPESRTWEALKAYEKYVSIDKAYGDMEDGFVVAQSWVNAIECAINVLALLAPANAALLLSFLASAMTGSKTVLYALVDPCQGFKNTGHNTPEDFALLYGLTAVWIVIPFMVVYSSGSKILSILNKKEHNA